MVRTQLSALIIGYARIDNIVRLSDQFFKLSTGYLYIHLDKGKTKDIQLLQREIIKIFSNHPLRDRLFLMTTSQNLGVKYGVISAIDWFYTQEDIGIILEDDLIASDDFYEFIDLNKDFLTMKNDVMMISGVKLVNDGQISRATWTNYAQIWGWATTSTKWKLLRAAIFDDLSNNSSRQRMNVKFFWKIGSWKVRNELIDTWDIPISEFMLRKEKYCLVPNVNMILNIGNDHFAIHTKNPIEQFAIHSDAIKNYEGIVSEDKYLISKKYNRLLEDKIFKIESIHYLLIFKLWIEKFRLFLNRFFL